MIPKVSIIVPLYNVEPYIERCARSLFCQTFTDVEYIFVDDCCQDNTMSLLRDVVNELDVTSKVRFCIHDSNKGLAESRLDGLLMAEGEYVLQVDSDDYIELDYVEQLVLSAEEYKSDIVICDYYHDYGEHKVWCHVNTPLDTDKCQELLMSGQMHNAVWNKLIRRSLYIDNGIRPIPGFNIYEDKIVMFQLFFYAQKISYVDKPLYYYNQTNNNSITAQNKSTMIKPALEVIKLLESFYGNKNIGPNIVHAIVDFKISIMGLILLYGSKDILDSHNELFVNPSLSQVLAQPVVPIYYKWAVIAYVFKLTMLLKPIKLALHFINRFPGLKRKLSYTSKHQ